MRFTKIIFTILGLGLIAACSEPDTVMKALPESHGPKAETPVSKTPTGPLKVAHDGIQATLPRSSRSRVTVDQAKMFENFEPTPENRENLAKMILTSDLANSDQFLKDNGFKSDIDEELIQLKDLASAGQTDLGEIKLQAERSFYASGHPANLKSDPDTSLMQLVHIGQTNGDTTTEFLALLVALNKNLALKDFYVVYVDGRSLLGQVVDQHLIVRETTVLGKAQRDLGEVRAFKGSLVRLDYYLIDRSLAYNVESTSTIREQMLEKTHKDLGIDLDKSKVATTKAGSFFPQEFIETLKAKDQSQILYVLKTADEVTGSEGFSPEKEITLKP